MYNQATPPVVDLYKVAESGVPMAYYVPKHDVLIPTAVQIENVKFFKDVIVDYHEFDGGHTIFTIAENMDYFRNETVKLIN